MNSSYDEFLTCKKCGRSITKVGGFNFCPCGACNDLTEAEDMTENFDDGDDEE